MRILELHALSFLGQPYIWGGDDPSGFDCSGLVIEILQGCGMLPRTMYRLANQSAIPYDATAQELFSRFEKDGVIAQKGLGALAFFGRDKNSIRHVGFMLDNKRMIEAGGGGKRVKSYEDAVKYNAFIRIRPLTWRKDLFMIIKPRYALYQHMR